MQQSPQTFSEMFGFEQPPASFDSVVLVIIDMQREYLDGAVPLPDIERTAEEGEPVVVKGLPNAFAGTELDSLIRETGRSQLILVGCTTHVCVSATARVALDLGYQTTVVTDATTSRDLQDANGNVIAAETVKLVALAELRDAFAVIVSSADDLL